MANQDLRTWTEYDPGGRMTVAGDGTTASTNISVDSTASAKVSKTVNSTSNFTWDFKVVFGSTVQYGANGNPFSSFTLIDSYKPTLWNYPSQAITWDSSQINPGTFYARWIRNGTSLWVGAYTDSGRTNLFKSSSWTLSSGQTLSTIALGKISVNESQSWQWITAVYSEVDIGALGISNATITPTVLNVSAALVTPDYFGASRVLLPAVFNVVNTLNAATVTVTSKTVTIANPANVTTAVISPTLILLSSKTVTIAQPVNVTAAIPAITKKVKQLPVTQEVLPALETSVANTKSLPAVLNVTPAIVSPTVEILAGDSSVSPDVVLATVDALSPTIDVMFRAVFA